MSEVAAPETLWLPPPDARLVNPRHDKFETPVDERGLIVVPDLIGLVKSTVDPDYEWPPGLSVHHLYFPEAWYTYDSNPEAIGDAGTFRNLPIHKALLPRVFENWLHTITLPVEIPDPEVRQYRIESWSIVRELFDKTKDTLVRVKQSRRRRASIEAGLIIPKTEDDQIGEEWIEDEFRKNFRGLGYLLERHEKLPPEFRLVDLDGPLSTVSKQLGKIAMPRSLILTRSAAMAS